MIGIIFGKVMWVGRATVFLVGLAVILALTVGLASAALAGTGVGATFNLGKTNTVNALSSLVGSVAGPALKVDNNSTGFGATALRLEVEPGKPPMSVNSTAEVHGLNVDSLDSRNSSDFLQESSDRDDFLPRNIYVNQVKKSVPPNSSSADFIPCDAGDVAIGGGFNEVNVPNSRVTSSSLQDVLRRDKVGGEGRQPQPGDDRDLSGIGGLRGLSAAEAVGIASSWRSSNRWGALLLLQKGDER